MRTNVLALTIILAVVFCLHSACKKEPSSASKASTTYLDLPATPYDYGTANDALVTLGRVLFYDRQLSVNNAISCASCHKQAYGFADNVALSPGFENRPTLRNSIAIQNINSNFGFVIPSELFWDGRETFLQNMVLQPLVNHVEMGMGSINEVSEKVKTIAYYPALFNDAFSINSEINAATIANALSAFVSNITSLNTKFDFYQDGMVQLTGMEASGMNLFFNKYNCNSCHQTQIPNGYQVGGGFVNIGLDVNYDDNGVGALSNNTIDNGKFKIPGLRNINLTAPYMHDGRFATLSNVIDHYSINIANHPNLDHRLKQNNAPVVFNISALEKDHLIAFLNTLTDYSLITDPKFSNPFKIK